MAESVAPDTRANSIRERERRLNTVVFLSNQVVVPDAHVIEPHQKGSDKISGQEEKELRRVFNYISTFNERAELERLMDKREVLYTRRIRNKITTEDMGKDGFGRGVKDSSLQYENIEESYDEIVESIEQIKSDLTRSSVDEDAALSPADIYEVTRHFGYKLSKREVHEMIWEVDDDLTGAITWKELKIMYQRNLEDKSGLEPCQLFHLIQFLMYDADYSGFVSADETMQILYTRYGKAKMESRLVELFGDVIKQKDNDVKLSMTQYIETVNPPVPTPRRLIKH